ncbi:phosphotransferase enzyme family protein [Rufibacter glacialis]|uniref:Aminoglycoside phosphotransferase family protein n=1 Tax=Rufibacter glacialis TaxID=1259555 RepID=A0A5M8QBA7_9BACT|nr:aminoglycoside phosphotransferase family protein [Rufibacter glacialis]KAA6432438.1 aminoglycoside phosphotransferase family protein [Rufibacter glacialis]GGK78665.1 hypothetical protein GCM10011405_28170 [Rufibacter glacialis]
MKDTCNAAAQTLTEVLAKFATAGTVAGIEPFGSGHIHDTYWVKTAESTSPDYLLQRVNHHVFKDVPALMENILLVTAHLRNKLAATPEANPAEEVLTLLPTRQNQAFYQDGDGNFWRMFLFLQNTRSYDLVETEQQAFEGGRAFGRFQALLVDLEPGLLHETIPHFHNLQSRLRLFDLALVHNHEGRAQETAAEIAFVQERAETMLGILTLGQEGKLPLRVTHNDTKFNNVLLNAQDLAQCVIDLDTVMPGYVAYDFGDAIRTTVNAAPEDEEDLAKIQVNLPLFEAFTKGYLQEAGTFLTEKEIESLTMGVTLLPFIMGLRFLTDYLGGDTYYKIKHPGHNLQRARAQFRLVQLLEEKQEHLGAIIQKTAQNCRLTAQGQS